MCIRDSDEALDRRVIAASLPVIKAIRNKLLVASGIEKADIICATLKGGLADVYKRQMHNRSASIKIYSHNTSGYTIELPDHTCCGQSL